MNRSKLKLTTIIALTAFTVAVIPVCLQRKSANAASKYTYKKGFTYEKISPNIEKRITGKSYRKNNNIKLSDLKGTLLFLAQKMFGESRTIRFRPSYFQFTEPSVEVDVSCHVCGGKGCPVCKGTGWIEILGAGMVHPNVLEMAGIDSKKYSGFAFGIGVERVAMLKYGITDIRNFYTNDLRFLKTFNRFE